MLSAGFFGLMGAVPMRLMGPREQSRLVVAATD
jgi:hypothetical protein